MSSEFKVMHTDAVGAIGRSTDLIELAQRLRQLSPPTASFMQHSNMLMKASPMQQSNIKYGSSKRGLFGIKQHSTSGSKSKSDASISPMRQEDSLVIVDSQA